MWKFKYGENEILVINKLPRAELYVNGQLQEQDGSKGIHIGSKASLTGKLGSGEEIKITLKGGAFEVKCSLYVNGELLIDECLSSEDTIVVEC